MAKKRSDKRQAQEAGQKRAPHVVADAPAFSATWRWLTLAVILLATFVTYLPVFDGAKEFTNWDDPAYVTEQPLVRSLDAATIKQMFRTESRVAANYHPLTMLTLAWDYQRGDGTMQAFMQTTLGLHLFNTALVFVLIGMLFRSSLLMPALCAAFFGLHPMHVESVAWVAERKDVLYTAFYLASLIGYIRYLRGGSWTWLVAAFASFVASCYAKPMAVTLPVVLVLLDVFEKRTFSVRTALEKVPFFIVSVIFGLLTLQVQSATGSGLVDITYYTLPERALFALYGITQYIMRLFAPFNLSAFYPYPSSNGDPETIVYPYALAGALMIGAIIWLYWKKRSEITTTMFFGMAFFVVTISVVLQLISVGGAVIADRYTYVPYLGLFIIVGMATERLLGNGRAPFIALAVVALASGYFAVLSNARIDVWQNSGVLFEDVLAKSEGRPLHHAYNNRALYSMERGEYERAERDYAYLESIGTDKAYTYKGYGALLLRMKRPADAIPKFTKALSLGGDDMEVYRARGSCHAQVKQYDSAVADFAKARTLAPNDPNVALALLESCLNANRLQDVLRYGEAMSGLCQNMAAYHNLMGIANGQLGNHAAAYKAFSRSLELNPTDENAKRNLEIARAAGK